MGKWTRVVHNNPDDCEYPTKYEGDAGSIWECRCGRKFSLRIVNDNYTMDPVE